MTIEAGLPSKSQAKLSLTDRVRARFGVLPNFFRLAPEIPEITAAMWGFAEFAYLDNPLPSNEFAKENSSSTLIRFASEKMEQRWM